jgi:N-acylneuraminate cytidylyltransferase
MKIVAIITARGGSKRIPRKNIRDFLGQPIISYPIQAALSAGIFSEVMVSTEDDEIAEVAARFGATVPFKRSHSTAGDHTTTAEVLVEVLEDYKKIGQHFDYACCIYPTAPFVTAEKLTASFEKIKQHNADTVLPVTAFSFPIWRSFAMKGNKVQYNWPENALKRSQDLPPAYHDCGQFYMFRVDRFLRDKTLITANTVAITVPESEVQDIDSPEDWKIAEIKYSFQQKN